MINGIFIVQSNQYNALEMLNYITTLYEWLLSHNWPVHFVNLTQKMDTDI